MNRLFVDTAGWFACADESDPVHRATRSARDAALERGHTLVTTDYVIDEALTIIRLRLSLGAAEAWWAQVRDSTRLRCEWINATRADQARLLFFRHQDKDFSFTDCTSFVVMQELKIRCALTTDAHFRQAGFEVVPDQGRARPGKRR